MTGEHEPKRDSEKEGGYEGWENYPTWAVHLWLANDQGAYLFMTELVERAQSLREAAGNIEEQIDEGNPLAEQPPTLYSDILLWAMAQVNWSEVAEAFKPEPED